jgi:hypothetical protein
LEKERNKKYQKEDILKFFPLKNKHKKILMFQKLFNLIKEWTRNGMFGLKGSMFDDG